MNKIEQHQNLLDQLHATYIAKNNDYGDSFGKSIEQWGYIAAMVRMSDKWNRLVSLMGKNKEQKVRDESIRDTLIDLANYCLLTVMEMDSKKVEDYL